MILLPPQPTPRTDTPSPGPGTRAQSLTPAFLNTTAQLDDDTVSRSSRAPPAYGMPSVHPPFPTIQRLIDLTVFFRKNSGGPDLGAKDVQWPERWHVGRRAGRRLPYPDDNEDHGAGAKAEPECGTGRFCRATSGPRPWSSVIPRVRAHPGSARNRMGKKREADHSKYVAVTFSSLSTAATIQSRHLRIL
ncbi:hypothetical protein HMN09_01101000 [Mycena chlorophos]|uniref:Uncharacterized protein n=1 Tax=Mycena chlorophos TaxID=658473 RepID=A0A8H6VWD5_MYCCL|nr:hypothetical protein HMN09_01101000 [Mycena chlorophos]